MVIKKGGVCDLEVSHNGLSATSHIGFVLVVQVLCYKRIKDEDQEIKSLLKMIN